MRYTEARLTRLAEEMLKDIQKETVDYQENFDGSLEEPSVLPAAYPNLLVNGSDGIAVGMATKIPPHNIGEAIDAVTAYIADPDITIDGLMAHLARARLPDRRHDLRLPGRQGRVPHRTRARDHARQDARGGNPSGPIWR